VGCRVRVVGAVRTTELNGLEGQIDGLSECPGFDWLVSIAGKPSWRDDGCWNAKTENLEPIVDGLNQVISWADMEGLWQPQGVDGVMGNLQRSFSGAET